MLDDSDVPTSGAHTVFLKNSQHPYVSVQKQKNIADKLLNTDGENGGDGDMIQNPCLCVFRYNHVTTDFITEKKVHASLGNP